MQVVPPLFLNESIFFDYSPPPTYAGHINKHPFRVHITSANDNDHIVWLDSKFSKSYGTAPKNLNSEYLSSY